MKISEIKMPKSHSEFGLFTLEGMPNVYYRFEYDRQGNALLKEDFFADNQPEEEKFKRLPQNSEMFKNIQGLLNEYIEKNQKEEL